MNPINLKELLLSPNLLFEWLAIAATVLLTTGSAIISYLARRALDGWKSKADSGEIAGREMRDSLLPTQGRTGQTGEGEIVSSVIPLTDHIQLRLSDVRSALRQQQGLERQYRWASGLLVFGQYIVGGVLASSFVQQSLSKSVVGILGVVVLFATLIKQQFRPEVMARAARARIVRLRSLLRTSEDAMVGLTPRDIDAAFSLVTAISKELGEIDQAGAADNAPETADQPRLRRHGGPAARG